MILLALLLAYTPPAGSLLRKAVERAQALGKAREVTLTGTLTVTGEAPRNAQLGLRFPLQCKLDADGGPSLSVNATRTDSSMNRPSTRSGASPDQRSGWTTRSCSSAGSFL